MTIVWGHNHFRLKSVQPHEIGLFDKAFNNISFDLQQKYGHLFWIPFISLGTLWTVNKGDGKKYVCPPEIVQLLDQTTGRSSKLSVFAWSGFLAIIAGVIIFSIGEKISDMQSRERYEERLVENARLLEKSIDSLTTMDYLLVKVKPQGQHSFNYTKLPLKVIDIKNDELLLGSYVTADAGSINTSDDKSLMKFLNNHRILDSFRVKRSLLKQAVSGMADESSFKGIELKDYYSAGTFKLDEIKRFGGPLPEENYAAEGKTGTYFELINRGFDADCDSLVAEQPGSSCKLSKQREFFNENIVAIQLFGPGRFILYCTDRYKAVYKYSIQVEGSALKIDKL